jgi:phosphoadenosine phosphosulfate reductase
VCLCGVLVQSVNQMRAARTWQRQIPRLSATSVDSPQPLVSHQLNISPSRSSSNSSTLISVEKFESLDPVDRVKAIYDMHGERAVQLSSMQKTAGVIMHLIHRAKVNIPILFFDTQYIHQETYDIKNAFQERYGLDIRTIKPELTVEQQDMIHGKDMWKTKAGQIQCCNMRKEKPLLAALEELNVEATLAGLMRTEGGARKNIIPVDIDPRNQNYLYYPIFDFNNQKIHDYTQEHNLPIHALYAQNYLSIGCVPCTTPVQPGEDARAGRWRHLRVEGETHAYCGMNYTDVKRDTATPTTPKKAKRKPLFKRRKPEA